MSLITHPEPLHAALDDIISAHGRWRVLLALVLRPVRRGATRPPPPLPEPRTLGLNDHLRRDIGLEPLPPGRDWLR